MNPRFHFFLVFLVSGVLAAQPAPAPTPAPTPAQQAAAAQASGEAQASDLTNAVAGTQTGGAGTQTTGQISIYTASLDNLTNSQQAQTISTAIAGELGTAAQTSYNQCSATTPLTDPDCYMSSTLVGMHDLSQTSSSTFGNTAVTAWSNVCVYSSITCGANVPNPYSSILPSPAPLTPEQIEEITRGLTDRGFFVNPRTGVVRVKGGKVINPSDIKSLKDTLGENETQKLLERIKSIERNALRKMAAMSREKVLKAYGLSGQGPNPVYKSLAGSGVDQSLGTYKFRERYPAAERKTWGDPEPGMMTDYRGEPVGVSRDSIFRMIQHRYQVKASQKTFMAP